MAHTDLPGSPVQHGNQTLGPRWAVMVRMPTLVTFSGTRSIGSSASKPLPHEGRGWMPLQTSTP